MTEVTEPTERVAELADRVDEDPQSVSVQEVLNTLESADVNQRRRLVSILDDMLAADPDIAPEVVDGVGPLFEHDNSDVRTVAATIAEHIAGRYPERAAPLVEQLTPLLHGDSLFARRHAVWALTHVSEARPDLVAPVVPDLRPAEDESAYFEEDHIITLLRNVAESDVEAIVPLVPALLEALEQTEADSDPKSEGVYTPDIEEQFTVDQLKGSIDVPVTAGELLGAIAASSPEELEPHVDDLVAAYESVSRRTVRREIAAAIAALADEDPDLVVDAVPALAPALESQDVPLQSRAARALGLIAASDPEGVAEAVAPRLDALAPLLEEGTPPVQASVAGLLSYVAEADPEAVAPLADALVAALETDDFGVRASGAIALGFVGGPDAESALRDLLDDDIEPELRETVRDSLGRIEARD